MAEKKKQHFVPRFYLKNFSGDRDRGLISLYVIESGLHCADVPCKDQAFENYYYGKNNGVEDALGSLEDSVAPIIASAITSNALPAYRSREHFALVKFLLFQHSRTPAHADVLNEQADKAVNILAAKFEDLRQNAGQFAVYDPNLPLLLLAVADELCPFALDLGWKLLGNGTDRLFITSDHPAVFYNQFLETRRTPGGNAAIQSRGLQIYLPIGPRHLLMLYDKDVYRIGGRKHGDLFIEIESDADVAGLNALQVANADEIIYFHTDTRMEHIHESIERGQPYRLAEKMVVRELPAVGPDGPRGSVIESSSVELRLGFKLERSAIIPSAAGAPIEAWGPVLRNPALVARFQEMRMPKAPIDVRGFLTSVTRR